jgi:hypothetical protein
MIPSIGLGGSCKTDRLLAQVLREESATSVSCAQNLMISSMRAALPKISTTMILANKVSSMSGRYLQERGSSQQSSIPVPTKRTCSLPPSLSNAMSVPGFTKYRSYTDESSDSSNVKTRLRHAAARMFRHSQRNRLRSRGNDTAFSNLAAATRQRHSLHNLLRPRGTKTACTNRLRPCGNDTSCFRQTAAMRQRHSLAHYWLRPTGNDTAVPNWLRPKGNDTA